jgi:hypothetical protein
MGPYRDGAMERLAGESGVKVNLWRPLPPNQSDPCVAELVTACACGGFISLFINSRVMHAHAPVGGSMRGMGKAAAPPRLIGRVAVAVAVAVAAAWASPTALPAAAGQRPACPAACAARAIRLGTATAATAALLRAAFRVVAGLPRRAPRTRNNLPAFDRSTFLACLRPVLGMDGGCALCYTYTTQCMLRGGTAYGTSSDTAALHAVVYTI